MNVFRQHRQKVEAEQAAQAAAASGSDNMDTAKASSIYEQMLVQMAAHKVELKAIQSMKGKAEKKAKFIMDYQAYVEGILAADEDVQDDVVVTIFVWAMDAGEFDIALQIADWALKHDLAAPPEFTRTIAAILAEELADAAIANRDNIGDYLDWLSTVLHMVAEKDMVDQVKAKLFKALGYANFDAYPNDALDYFKQAVELNPRIGVKKDIKKLDAKIKDLSPAPAPTKGEKTEASKTEVKTPKVGAAGDKPVKQAATDEQQ